MSSRLSSLIKKRLFGKNKNLISLEEPYLVMANLLKDHTINNVIDAGASNGRISRRLLQLFSTAQAYAFEPNPMYAEILNLYAEKEKRFHPQFLALSDTEGSAILHVTESPGSTSLFEPDERLKEIQSNGASVKKDETIQVVTIDNWAKNNNISSIELMKFDIQAGELKAMQGAVNTLKNSTILIYTEILFNSLYKDGAIFSEIDLFLRKYGFMLYDIFKPKYAQKNQLMWANAIYINNSKLGI